MKIRILYAFLVIVLPIFITSCGEYNKILKSPDTALKYTYAKKYFDEKKYSKAITLLEDVLPSLKGTSYAEEALFLTAQSHFYDKDYYSANQYYNVYNNTYPKGEYSELARYNAAYGLYLDSPDPRLDQTNTVKSMQQFQTFLDLYPHSDKVKQATEYLFEMQEKLAYKEYMAARLYFNLGNYMGNNYESCIITAQEAIKNYPYSKYLEEYQILALRSRFELAKQSINEKKADRYRAVIDEQFNYKNMFPDGKYIKEAEHYYEDALKEIEKDIDANTNLQVYQEKKKNKDVGSKEN